MILARSGAVLGGSPYHDRRNTGLLRITVPAYLRSGLLHDDRELCPFNRGMREVTPVLFAPLLMDIPGG
jgi:hypothetical protein